MATPLTSDAPPPLRLPFADVAPLVCEVLQVMSLRVVEEIVKALLKSLDAPEIRLALDQLRARHLCEDRPYALTPNTVELIPTLGALFPRGGSFQDIKDIARHPPLTLAV